jgi:hypothetical protein
MVLVEEDVAVLGEDGDSVQEADKRLTEDCDGRDDCQPMREVKVISR